MESLRVSYDGWSLQPVFRARSFFERWRGLRGLGEGASMIIETSSVHAVGMRESFRAIGLSEDLVVAEIRLVRPWQAVRFPGCRYVMEMPIEEEAPRVGSRVEVEGA